MTKRVIRSVLAICENILLRIPVKTSDRIIFLTGAPRSGTTITYQYFIEYGKFCFFTNRERKNRQYPIISALLFRGADKYIPTEENSFGHIPGINAPSDGWEIFHRWFPYYYNPKFKLSNQSKKCLYRTISWYHKIYKKPFLVKNNANSLRIKELKEIFPDALFIHVKRNQDETVKSIISGMIKNNVTGNGLWGTGPEPHLIPQNINSIEEKAKYQLEYIDKYISSFQFVKQIKFYKNNTSKLKVDVVHHIKSIEKE